MKYRIQQLGTCKIDRLVSQSIPASRRFVHSSKTNHAPLAATSPSTLQLSHTHPKATTREPCLAILPTSTVLRSYLITRMSSSPVILRACFTLLRKMLDSKSFLLNPERNFMLKWIFKHTFYAQFCAGENKFEVQRTVSQLKSMGYTGAILEYALEVLDGGEVSAEKTAQDIETWRKGMLQTVEIASAGDFVGLKWSGIGTEALKLLKANKPPTPAMLSAIHEACDLAAQKGVFVLPGAEEEITNTGLDTWTLDLMRRYNKDRPMMYNTYQSYLRSTPAKLAQHLVIAQREGFTAGIKVVRGAYLLMEPKHAVWNSKEETDVIYDGLVEGLLKRKYNSILKPVAGSMDTVPKVGLMIASHNLASVQKAQAIRSEQAQKGEERIECAYAQLQGMADEISLDLVQASKAGGSEENGAVDKSRTFKCATWGTVTQCMNFLLRRAAENQDAAGRTADTSNAMGRELMRRWKAGVGLS
ncbi:FAD-linked oxidoreductase [Tothia fuscella]|uniref:Proline dehydrogenase n=1 Tax=Tothia fuscella TaxID=1048955 RepID=A0A9P4TSD2_9PEZI|nr:FAD-linked oxidoreductase [Tothia fuscella]